MTDESDGIIRDDSNQVEAFAAGGKDMLAKLKVLFKDSWKELRTAVMDAMRNGVVAFRGLQAANNQVSEARYTHWAATHGKSFLRLLNQLPESKLFGGTLVADDRLVRQLMGMYDRLLIDLMLLAAKGKRTNLAQECPDSEAQRLLSSLPQMGVDLGVEWEKKYENLVAHNQDVLVLALLYQLWGTCIPWIVVLFVSHKAVQDWTAISGARSQDEFGPNDDEPTGTVAGYHFAGSGDPSSLWKEIVAKTCGDLDPVLFAPPEQFTRMAGDSAPICYFRITANPSAVAGAVFDYLHSVSGLLALFRPVDETEWRREFATFQFDESQLRVHLADPSSARCLAIPVPTTNPFFFGMPIAPDLLEKCAVRELTANQLLTPLTQAELDRLAKLFATTPMLGLVAPSLAANVTLPGLRRLTKAFRFWAKAELARVAMEDVNFSVWSLGEVFLDYCMAMEIILGEKSETVEKVASRAAVLLADSAGDRLKLFTDVKELYDKRSQYVHAGTVGTRISDVLQMRDVARQCILYNLQWAASYALANLSLAEVEGKENLRELTGKLQQLYSSETPAGEVDAQALRRWEVLCEKLVDERLFVKHCDRLRFGESRIRFDDDGWSRRILNEIIEDNERYK